MVEKFKGIVLRTLKYSDNLMIADIFTESRGRVSFLLPMRRVLNLPPPKRLKWREARKRLISRPLPRSLMMR